MSKFKFDLAEDGMIMNKFKRGDLVRCVSPHEGQGLFKGNVYEVTSVGEEYIKLKNDDRRWFAHRFELVSVEDVLPEVPKSVMHVSFDRTVRIVRYTGAVTGDYVLLHTGYPNGLMRDTITLTPEGALQLAHDILRQAMQAKRGTKAKGGNTNV